MATDYYSSSYNKLKKCRNGTYKYYQDSESHHLFINGYLRDIMADETDYNDLISIIMAYHQREFASFFDVEKDPNYRDKMQFGDIAKTGDDKLMIMTMNHSLLKIASIEEPLIFELYDSEEDSAADTTTVIAPSELDIHIPLKITQYLAYDAISFYADCMQIISHWGKERNYDCSGDVMVPHDDGWIIDYFGGSINKKIESIKVYFKEGNMDGVLLRFTSSLSKKFNCKERASYKDIDRICEIYQNKNNLVKIDTNYIHDGVESDKLSIPTMWFYNSWSKYIGPKTEIDIMLKILNGYYNITLGNGIKIVDVDNCDLIK